MNTILLINYEDITSECRKYITYSCIVVRYRHQIDEPNRTQLTVGGNIIEYPGGVGMPNVGATTSKIVWNSVVSVPKAKYIYINI